MGGWDLGISWLKTPIRQSKFQKRAAILAHLHMSPVTELARLPRRILLFVHMGNFSAVDWDAIRETQPKWWNLIIHGCSNFVDSWNFTNKANSPIPQGEIHKLQKSYHFRYYVSKAKPFCLRNFVTVNRAGVFIRENFHLVSERSWSRVLIWTHRDFLRMEGWWSEISESKPDPSTGLYKEALKSVFHLSSQICRSFIEALCQIGLTN